MTDMTDLPNAAELRRLVKQHGSYRAAGLALGIEPKRVEYAARKAGIPSPRSREHLLVCIFCGIVGNARRPVHRYHLKRSTHQARRAAGSLVICDDCYPRKVTPPRNYPTARAPGTTPLAPTDSRSKQTDTLVAPALWGRAPTKEYD